MSSSNNRQPERKYTEDGILLGSHTLEERDAYVIAKVEAYDAAHPGNTLSLHKKKKYARYKWLRKVRGEIERDRMAFEGIAQS
jgi:hypothetical protein